MPRNTFCPRAVCALILTVGLLLSATVAWCASYKVVFSFRGGTAKTPSSGLVQDAAGNAFGTTAESGAVHPYGTVYELSPTSGYHSIYSFQDSPDGRLPQGNLVVDAAGNLYGTTVYGGANKSGCNRLGCGTVFKLSPPTNGGTWTETVLYSFTGGSDGSNPQAGVILDSAGNLFGTTKGGGGVVFELTAGQGDQWAETILYSFDGGEGALPLGGLLFDGAGNLYGTTSAFGPRSGGCAFELSPAQNGTWTLTLIYAFDGSNGSQDGLGPGAGLIFDTNGNLYGTTVYGGTSRQDGGAGYGTVFQLTPTEAGWTENVLYSFGGHHGAIPESSLVIDTTGNLYGTTYQGGLAGTACPSGCGTIFKLSKGENGQWTEKVFRFPSDTKLGAQPTAPLILDTKGRAYGTTTRGGAEFEGVIFKMAP